MKIADSFLQQWYQEVWNQEQEHRIDDLIHPNGLAHGLDDTEGLRGPAGFRQFYQGFRRDFDQVHVEVQRVVAEDDYETALCLVSARHKATGRPVIFSGLNMVRIKDNQIYEAWNQFDFMSLQQQLA